MEQKTVSGECKRATKLAKAQRDAFKPQSEVVSELGRLFGEEARSLRMTEAGDALYARLCHNKALPCSDQVSASGQCVEAERSESIRICSA